MSTSDVSPCNDDAKEEQIPISSRHSKDYCRIYVLSDAGKPIFVWNGRGEGYHRRDEEVDTSDSRICGLIQALCSSIRHGNLQEEIQTLESASMLMVFMTAGAITLVAVTSSSTESTDDMSHNTEAYLRTQLEYIYAQIVMSFTDQIQSIFEQNASFDLRHLLLGSGEAMIRTMLQEALSLGYHDGNGDNSHGDPAPFLVAGVPVFGPLSFAARERASTVLQQVGDETVQTFAALFMVGNKLLTIVQSSYPPHQLQSTDLNLVLHFVNRQQINSELWLPLCLPRFNSSGFMHCYVGSLDAATKLTLVLMSQDGSTEQFQAFRTAGRRIRRCLGIPLEDRSVLEILASNPDSASSVGNGDAQSGTGSDVSWRRNTSLSSDKDFEDDYEMVSYFDEATNINGEPCTLNLLSELLATNEDNTLGARLEALLGDDHSIAIRHFCFRVDVPIIHEHHGGSGKRKGNQMPPVGLLTQCLTLGQSEHNGTNERSVWSTYQQLHLRLRLGSASSESIQDALASDNNRVNELSTFPTIGRHCLAMKLSESLPSIEGFTYVTQGSETYLAMNGRGFELHLTTDHDHPIDKVAACGARLIRRILSDQQTLFVSHPRTWKA